MFISLVLQDLYVCGYLKAPSWKEIEPPRQYSERSLLRFTLELVEKVITDDERKAFTADGTSAADLEKFGKSVEKNCMHQMLLYKGGDPSVKAQTGSAKQATYLGLGRRVRIYKKLLTRLTGVAKPPLQDCPLEQAGTPVGNTLIVDFFGVGETKADVSTIW